MTAPSDMAHEQAANEIEAVALGIATEELSQQVPAHATRCPECAAELRSFYQVVASLSSLIPARQLNRGHSAGIKSRLFAKATAGQEGGGRRTARAEPARAPEPRTVVARPARSDEDSRAVDSSGNRLPFWIAAGSVLIALAAVGALLSGRSEGAPPESEATSESAEYSQVTELERAVAEREATIASLSGPGVRIIGLFNREAREPLGRMFWDRRSDQWTLFVYSLRQPRPGKTFQVWLGTESGRVPLGTFQPASDGTATFVARHEIPMASLNTVSISEEDTGDSPSAPTGPVVLAGALR